jgi:sugar phosphate isomerase/epimerase
MAAGQSSTAKQEEAAVRLGCSTILFGGFGLEQALASIKAAGYDAIELAAIPSMADHLPGDARDADYRAIAQRVAAAGLAIESIGGSTNLLDPASRTRFIALLRAASLLGAPAVTTGSGGISDDEASFARVVATINDLARVGADLDVRLSIKPHVNQAVYSTPTALRFMGEVDRRWVGLNFDASHLYRADEDPVVALAALAPHLATCRIRDIAGKQPGPGPVENQIPGKGALDLPPLCTAIARLSLPYVTLEIVGARDLPLADVERVARESQHYLARFIQ